MADLKTIGKNIEKYRKERGYTQIELAGMLGYSNSSPLAKIEKGLINPSITRLSQIAQTLCVPLEKILGEPVDEYKLLVEAFKAAPLDKKVSVKLTLGIAFNQEEIDALSRGGF